MVKGAALAVTPLPPKMLAQYVQRAKNGEAEEITKDVNGKPCVWHFYHGRNRVTLSSLNPPSGHIYRMTAAEVEQRSLKKRQAELTAKYAAMMNEKAETGE